MRGEGGARYQPMVLVCAAAVGGIVCDRRVELRPGAWAAMAVVGLLSWMLVRRKRREVLGTALILWSALCTGALWHQLRWSQFPQDELGLCAREAAQPVVVDVQACSSVRRLAAPGPDPLCTMPLREESQVSVRFLRVRDGDKWRTVSGQSLLSVPGRMPEVRDGDRLRVFGVLYAAKRPWNPGEQDSADYDRAMRRMCRLQADSPACVFPLPARGPRWHGGWMQRLRDGCNKNLWRYLGNARAGLATAVLLGAREELGRERQEDYMTTGTVHLLSISGLHLAILAYGFWFTARLGYLRRKVSLAVAILFAATYAVFTDAQPPVVRAAVLVIILCLGRWTVRRPLNFNTLAVAGLVVAAINPSSVFHAGAQLSFLAVGTMAALPWMLGEQVDGPDPLQRLIAATRPWPERGLRAVVRVTVNAWRLSAVIWVVALPLVVYRFHIVSPIATVLNPIVCLPMAVALFSGFGVMVLGWCAPPLAALAGTACDASLALMEWTIVQALHVPGNHFWVPAPPGWSVGCFYLAIVFWMAFPAFRPPARWMWVFVACWLAGGCWWMLGPSRVWRSTRAESLRCTFVAVGHGTSVLLELPDGRNLLYDAGRLGPPIFGTRAIANVLWSRGIRHVDAVVISHADADHFNALPDLLDRFSVGVIYVSPTMFDSPSPAVRAWCVAVARHDIDVRVLSAGDRLIAAGGCELRVWHPPAGGIAGSDNANSIVLMVKYQGRRLLLPGDLESPGTEMLLNRRPVDCDVIMAPHHGSLRSDPRGFTRWSTPEAVVISGGPARDSDAVLRAFAAGNAEVFHTARHGAVEVVIDRQGSVGTRSFRPEHARPPRPGGRPSRGGG